MTLSIALAQIGPTLGALRSTPHYKGNKDLILETWHQAKAQKADLLVTPEFSLIGYPAKDLVQRRDFLHTSNDVLNELVLQTQDGPALLVGAPLYENGKVYNGAYFIEAGEIKAIIRKHELPNYGPFDDKRNFSAGDLSEPVDFRGAKLGILICEDTWFPKVSDHLKDKGADILISMNASPFQYGKHILRMENVARVRTQETQLPLVYVNQCVAIDGLPFDGSSFVINANQKVALQMPSWEQAIDVAHFTQQSGQWICQQGQQAEQYEDIEAIYRALVLGTRDYLRQNGFEQVILGLSGGIDSGVVAMIASDAIGGENVIGLRMPSRFSSSHSLDDAEMLAQKLGIQMKTIPIEMVVQQYHAVLDPFAETGDMPIADENIQARIRGNIIMYFSNKEGRRRILPLTTGNKSELAVGYATLYGDMCGGFNPLKDVWKTTVYKLAQWRNTHKPDSFRGHDGVIIPSNMLEKSPSAELRDNQKDQDSLPPYEKMDDILRRFIERGQTVAEIIAAGHAADMVNDLWRKLDAAEYKRQQAAPGIDISGGEFTREYRMPISNHFSPAQLFAKES